MTILDAKPPTKLSYALLPRILEPIVAGRALWIVSAGHLLKVFPDATLVKTFQASQGPASRGAVCQGAGGLGGKPIEVVLALDVAELAAGLAAAGPDPSPDLTLIFVGAQPPAMERPLGAFHQHLLLRAVAGVLAVDARFPEVQAARLRPARDVGDATLHVLVWSGAPLPDLPLGLHGLDKIEQRSAPEAASPPWVNNPPPATGRAGLVALAGRLQAVEDRSMALRAENIRLANALAGAAVASTDVAAFDVPRNRHPWPLQEEPGRDAAAMGLYDRRPDDVILQEARAGEAFFAAFMLEGEAPDFAGAVAALNRMSKVLDAGGDAPDLSIVIPVYGQLPYTLNALDSLFGHRSRYSAEIILIDDCSPDGVTAVFGPKIGGIRYHRQAVNGGFINSCNTGGAMARGRYVVMLNSDVRVAPGWMDSLLDSFLLFPKAGLVGSKMLYPDGSLQEAGGILWRDGSAWNYGRDDDPNRPQYCYARQVDYVSGCSIALPTPLWRELGGFDPLYTPAYAEDADLCQRVISAGFEVWYQPLSRMLHYEGKTSGTSTGAGVKAYQVINLKKLFLRFRPQFEQHRRNADNPFMERERGVRKRILIVDSVTPTPDQDAGSAQTILGLRCCRLAGYKASFVPEDNWLFVPGYTQAMQQSGVDCSYAPFEVGFENYIRRYGWLFDVVLTYRVHVMSKSMALIRAYAPQAVVIFHVADLHYLRMQRQAAMDKDEGALQAAEELKEKELDVIQRADCTITHSTVEAAILAAEVPRAPVVVWPLMMDVVGTRVGFAARRDVCFLGGYRHPPNVKAVVYFVTKVFPLLRLAEPGIRFIIAGANPTPEVEALACDDVIVTGMVDDLREVFDACRVFVCPLLVGAGAKGKVVSALAHGIPVVSTGIGVEGAGLTKGEHALVAETPRAMTKEILRLYRDPALWNRLSSAGLALIERDFSTEMGRQKLEEAVEKAYRQKLDLVDA